MLIDRRELLIGAGGLGLCACSSRAETGARSLLARTDLYQCEGCEGALERRAATLAPRTRIAGPADPGVALIVTGTVFASDGRTPAPGVVLYVYHTNSAGLYANGGSETAASRRHGRLRGWVRTDAGGQYRIDTIKPAPYPSRTLPAHLHFTVLEPGRRPYWIDDIVFAGEFGVTDAYRRSMTNKGGDGIVHLGRSGNALTAKRDIVLEVHPA